MEQKTANYSGLESQLRNMILTNNDSNADNGPRDTQDTLPPGLRSPQTPKAGKRRPNQAQRRQMNSQFVVPINSWSAPAPVDTTNTNQVYSHPVNQNQYSPRSQRQLPNRGGRGSYSSHHEQSSWNGPHRHHHSSNVPFNALPPPNTYEQNRQTATNSNPSSPSRWRQPTATPLHYDWQQFTPEQIASQAAMLNRLCQQLSGNEIDRSEIEEKESFRKTIEAIVRDVIVRNEPDLAQSYSSMQTVELRCFGSLSSGFATKASDMDLALLSPFSAKPPHAPGSPIPRLVEKALLDAGFGARLLTRTRVPIIKLCERPPQSLYHRLVECREAWDNGLTHEDDEHHEPYLSKDNEDDQKSKFAQGKGQSHRQDKIESAPQSKAHSHNVVEFEIPTSDGGEPQRFYLGQGAGQSLESYFVIAKRVLGKATRHDSRRNKSSMSSNSKYDASERVCEAFLKGLADANLRESLEQYPSLSFRTHGLPDRHTLQAVYTQIEGEKLAQSWRDFVMREGLGTRYQLADLECEGWRYECNRMDYGVNIWDYAKTLQAAYERLKSSPLIQCAALEQLSNETPTQYHVRARKIFESFRDKGITPPMQHGIFERQAICGIRPFEIREKVVKAGLDAIGQDLTLDIVARKHKSIHLAHAFSKALERELYDTQHTSDITEYIKLLEGPLRKVNEGNSIDYLVPITNKKTELVSRIRDLPDPNILPAHGRHRSRLEFPKDNAGVQCDINFSADLALHNTALLRCYSHSDPRVRPMVLFIKHWAKTRGINSGYHGTLSSYGYVLMVLHYLVNIAAPFVCPNLQQLAPPVPPGLSDLEVKCFVNHEGYDIRFWRNEEEIRYLAANYQLNKNQDSIGLLLRGFFEYFAQNGPISTAAGPGSPIMNGFDWGRDTLSLRTVGGIRSKQEKGWTGAKTLYVQEGDEKSKEDKEKAIRCRYLLAIEDPFEIDHNVGRTVTHNGIVAIREEFRRAWRIIRAVGGNGSGDSAQEQLLERVSEGDGQAGDVYEDMLNFIHGSVVWDDYDD